MRYATMARFGFFLSIRESGNSYRTSHNQKRSSKMHSKDKLAEALRNVGLNQMADRAAEGYYHDFMSPLPLPEMQLVRDLTDAMYDGRSADAGQPLAALRKRVIDGEFDATAKESEEWAASPEGREAFNALIRK